MTHLTLFYTKMKLQPPQNYCACKKIQQTRNIEIISIFSTSNAGQSPAPLISLSAKKKQTKHHYSRTPDDEIIERLRALLPHILLLLLLLVMLMLMYVPSTVVSRRGEPSRRRHRRRRFPCLVLPGVKHVDQKIRVQHKSQPLLGFEI